MSHAATYRRRSVVARFFRNPRTDRVVVVQPPNAPLWVWSAVTAVRLIVQPHGWVGALVTVVATISLAWWSLWEVARGDSPFRRVLGGLVLLGAVVSVLLR